MTYCNSRNRTTVAISLEQLKFAMQLITICLRQIVTELGGKRIIPNKGPKRMFSYDTRTFT